MKKIITLSLPIMVNRSSGQLAAIVVVAILSNINTNELAYFSLMLAAISVVFGFVSLISSGVQNFSATLYGKNDIFSLRVLFRSGLLLSAAIGVIGYILSNININIFLIIGENEIFANHADRLFKLLSIAIPIISVISFFSLFLEGVGLASFTAKVKLFEICAQVLLTSLLLFGMTSENYSPSEWAVISLIISDLLALMIYVAFFFSKKGRYFISFNFQKSDFVKVKEIFHFGLPIAIGMSCQKLAYASISFIVASLGEVYLSTYTIIMNMIFLSQIPVQGIAHSNSILISRSIGEKLYNNVSYNLNSTCKLVFVINSISISSFLFMSNNIISFFTDEPNVRDMLLYSTFGMVILVIGQSSTSIIISYLRALYDTWVPQLTILASFFILIIPVLLILGKFYQLDLNLIMISMGGILTISSAFLYFRSRDLLRTISIYGTKLGAISKN